MNTYGWIAFIFALLDVGVYMGFLSIGKKVYISSITHTSLVVRIIMAFIIYKAVNP